MEFLKSDVQMELAPSRQTSGAALSWLSSRIILYRTLIIAGFFLSWELLADLGVLNVLFTSKPSLIIQAAVSLADDPDVHKAFIETLGQVGVSFGIGAFVGIVVGAALGLNRFLGEAYLRGLVLLIGIPKSVFLPLFIMFFGLGMGPGIAFGILLSFMQVAINVVGGIQTIEPQYYMVAKAYGANPIRVFFDVILPGASPGIFAGLWHGIRNAFIGVVVAQLFVSNIGIGYLVRLYSNNFRISNALAVVISVAVVVISVGVAWGGLERRLMFWRGLR